MGACVRQEPSLARKCGRAVAVTASSAAFALGSVCYAAFLVVFSAVLAVSGGAYYAFARLALERFGQGERTGRK